MVSSSEILARSAEGRANGTIRSVDKVVDILEVLSRESQGLALGELAKRLDLNASTAHHLLATLKARGIVAQDERTKTYRIGYRLVSLVSRFLSGTDLYPAAIGPVEELRDLSGETSYFSAFQGGEVAVIIALTGAPAGAGPPVPSPGSVELALHRHGQGPARVSAARRRRRRHSRRANWRSSHQTRLLTGGSCTRSWS